MTRLSVNVVASIQRLGVLRLGRVCWLEFSFFRVLSTDRFDLSWVWEDPVLVVSGVLLARELVGITGL